MSYVSLTIESTFNTLNSMPVNQYTTVIRQIRLYAPPDRVNETRYALDVAMSSVDHYTSTFNMPYPLPKLGEETMFCFENQ